MLLTASKFRDLFPYEPELNRLIGEKFPDGIDLSNWDGAKQASMLQFDSRLWQLLRDNGVIPSFDMEGWDLRELVFQPEERFERINAWKVRFDRSELTGARFEGAFLGKATFIRTHAHYARFNGATLNFAQFHGARVNDSDFTGAVAILAEFADTDGWLCSAVNCKFRGTDLRDAVFINADMKGSDFRGAVLRGVGFSKADLRNCDFRGAELHEAVFGLGTKVHGAEFDGADLGGRTLEEMLAQADKGEAE